MGVNGFGGGSGSEFASLKGTPSFSGAKWWPGGEVDTARKCWDGLRDSDFKPIPYKVQRFSPIS